jgi:hypothetical protein
MDNEDISNVMRRLAAARDSRLRVAGAAIPPDRLASLRRSVASVFPVEMALIAATKERDELLRVAPVIPAPIELALQKRLRVQQPLSIQPERVRPFDEWVHVCSRLIASAPRVAAAVAFVLFVGASVHFATLSQNAHQAGISKDRQNANVEVLANAPDRERLDNALLAKSEAQLTLRVTRLELASLRHSLLTLNRAFLADKPDPDHGLPLDLPFRQILIDADAAEAP